MHHETPTQITINNVTTLHCPWTYFQLPIPSWLKNDQIQQNYYNSWCPFTIIRLYSISNYTNRIKQFQLLAFSKWLCRNFFRFSSPYTVQVSRPANKREKQSTLMIATPTNTACIQYIAGAKQVWHKLFQLTSHHITKAKCFGVGAKKLASPFYGYSTCVVYSIWEWIVVWEWMTITKAGSEN